MAIPADQMQVLHHARLHLVRAKPVFEHVRFPAVVDNDLPGMNATRDPGPDLNLTAIVLKFHEIAIDLKY